MRQLIKKSWVPLAIFIAVASVGVFIKKTYSDRAKYTRGMIIDTNITSSLWCGKGRSIGKGGLRHKEPTYWAHFS